MKVSELIATLEAMMDEHGDIAVFTVDYSCCDHIEQCEGTDGPTLEINIAYPTIGIRHDP